MTVTGIDYTDYTIRADNKLFVMRPYPLGPKEAMEDKITGHIARYTGWNWLRGQQRSPIPVTIPANVGDKVDIAPFGDRAFVRYRNRQYACTVVRQVLLSAPDTMKDWPQDNATQPAPPAN